MIPSAIPLNVRDVDTSKVIGTPQDTADQDTIIGLLKRIIVLLG